MVTRPVGGPLAHRSYRFLLVGGTAQSLGNAITPVALAFAVLELGGSASQLGLVVAAFATVEVMTLLFGGVLGDRVPRQLMMQGASAVAGLAHVSLATILVTGNGSILLVGVVGMVDGCVGALGGPSSQAMTRQTVPEEELPSAVALRRLCSQTAQVAGYAAAGMVVALVGAGWALAVDGLAFGVAALCYHGIRVPAVVRTEAPGTILAELRSGATEVFRHTWLWLLIGQALVYHLFYGGVQGVLGPVVVGERWNEAVWGWALAVLMGGFIVGGLVCLRWRPERGLRIGVMLLTLTAAFPLAMALSDSLVVLLLGAALHGFGLEVFSINWDLSIQENVAEEKLSRVYAFDMVGSFVVRPLGLVVAGPVSALLGMTQWLLVVAVVIVVSCVLSGCAPSVRRLTRRAWSSA